jgi:hypothetical protein
LSQQPTISSGTTKFLLSYLFQLNRENNMLTVQSVFILKVLSEDCQSG